MIVSYPLNDMSALEHARAVSPEFEIAYIPVNLPGDALRRFASGTRETLQDLTPLFGQELLDRLPEAEILYGLYFPVELLDRAPKLKWIANIGSGTEQYRALGILESPVHMTSAKGVAARALAEFAMAQMLMLTKNFHNRLRLQLESQWKRVPQGDLYGQTLGIVGLGEIGTHLARFAKAFDMRVLATRRRVSGGLPPNVDAMYPIGELRAMLAQCDVVAVAVALTQDTHGLIGRDELAVMKKSAFLVNVARGEVMDEPALIDALKKEAIAGAALDVFVQEPLPKDSPLWGLPNVILSPHNAVTLTGYPEATFNRFVENFRRYVRGEPLQQVVDPQYGS